MAFDAKVLRVPEIRWLGVFPSDAEKYHLPDRCLLPLTPKGQISVFIVIFPYKHKEQIYFLFFLVACLHSFALSCITDKNKAETMLQRCYLHREAPQWRFTFHYFCNTLILTITFVLSKQSCWKVTFFLFAIGQSSVSCCKEEWNLRLKHFLYPHFPSCQMSTSHQKFKMEFTSDLNHNFMFRLES